VFQPDAAAAKTPKNDPLLVGSESLLYNWLASEAEPAETDG